MAVKELIEALHFTCTFSFWRMVFLWTFPLIVSYIKLLNQYIFTNKPIYNRCAVLPLPPITSSSTSSTARNSSGRQLPVCIITGATSGLGAASALALSKEGFFVVLAGRSLHKLSKVMSDIRKLSNEAYLQAFEVDLLSFSSIMRFKESLEKWLLDSDMHPSIQLLINNAGILATTSGLTAEGHDRMMGINYIGAFSLTEALLPLLKNSPCPSRVVNVTSFTHRNGEYIELFRWMEARNILKHCLTLGQRKRLFPASIFQSLNPTVVPRSMSTLNYAYYFSHMSSIDNIISLKDLIQYQAADPGAVKTNIMREVPWYISQVAFTALHFLGLLQSPHVGISSILDASLAPPETSGLYFFGGNGRTIDSSALSYNLKLSRELWDTSCDIFQDSLLNYKRISTCNEKVD